MRTTFAMGLLFALSAGAFACSTESSAPAAADDAPADDQAEQDITSGVTKLASKLQDPAFLSSQGDNLYFATTYGFATQEEAEYHHDIWIKTKDGKAKRLYKNLWGATYGMTATKNGLYEINEGYASVMRYPLDGSKPEGESLLHAIYGHEELPEVGITKLAADDDGFAVAVRTEDGDTVPDTISAYSPNGKSNIKLGSVTGATALTVAGTNVLVGTRKGEVFLGARSGAGSLKKIAAGTGAVGSIIVVGTDTFFGTTDGLYVLHKGAASAQRMVQGAADELLAVPNAILFAQRDTGISSVPVAGGAAKVVFKTKAASDLVLSNGSLFVTDSSLGACKQTDDGQACAFDGSFFRVKL